MKDGPPRGMECECCGDKMYQDLTGQGIVFKGWWPGEEVRKENSGDNGRAREMNDENLHSMKRKQEAVDETMEARRQGRKKSAEFKKNNPETWKTAEKALTQGIKPKKADYAQIKKDMIKNAKKKLKSNDKDV